MEFNFFQRLIIVAMFFFGALLMYQYINQSMSPQNTKHWKFQSIDTMKYSRDRAREYFNNPSYAKTVDTQVNNIAAAGANYVAIDTPYDDEFRPVLKIWVKSARAHNLHIWFRGNFSGWEQWFGYERIDRATHIKKTDEFIRKSSDLFADGDVFSSCPECENGEHINASNPTQIIEYRKFLISEYETTKTAFKAIGKNVASNYYSMNLDVAKAVMDPQTTQAMDGLVVIDHYVKSPQAVAQDVVNIAQLTGGRVILGETGAPIPDIHGDMTPDQQRKWLLDAMILLSSVDKLDGINYWVNKDGSTALWNADDSPRPALEVLKQFYGAPTQPEE